jgi:hypothetical protein
MTSTFNREGQKRITGLPHKTEQTSEQIEALEKLKGLQKEFSRNQFDVNSYLQALAFKQQADYFKALDSEGFKRINQKTFKELLISAQTQISLHEARQNQISSQND